MIEIPNLTMICVDTKNYAGAIRAIRLSLEQIKPEKTIFLSDIKFSDLSGTAGFEAIEIKKINSKEEYSEFIVKELHNYFQTDHCLLIQHDGYVLDGKQWNQEFLKYDYIGAIWQYGDGRDVGNGGFSIRSLELMQTLAVEVDIEIVHPEDEITCRLYRTLLEKEYNIKFAPPEIAESFSFELNEPIQPTFGFHGYFYPPFKKKIVLARKAAMGDIIMMEPVMEWVHKKGYEVVLDIEKKWMPLFKSLPYPVKHLSETLAKEKIPGLNFDMAYEMRPQQLALKSYYEHVQIQDGEIRNSNLEYYVPEGRKLFRQYVVVHVNQTDMPYRNIYGVDWRDVEIYLKESGYEVIQIGDDSVKIGTWVNTQDIETLMYVIAGADLFIGSDSGPAHIAVGCKIPSVIFFGSVNPMYRFSSLDNIWIMQSPCEKKSCYHSVVGVSGTPCLMGDKVPRCSIHTTESLIEGIKSLI